MPPSKTLIQTYSKPQQGTLESKPLIWPEIERDESSQGIRGFENFRLGLLS